MNMAAYWIRGELDVKALRASIVALRSRHEGLRTSFSSGSRETVSPGSEVRAFQHISATNEHCALHVVDVSSTECALSGLRGDVARGRARAEALGQMTANSLRSVDVSNLPELSRFRLFRVAEEEHLLCIEAHHAIVDGTSWGLLADDLAQGYATALGSGRTTGSEEHLPSLTDTFMRATLGGAWQYLTGQDLLPGGARPSDKNQGGNAVTTASQLPGSYVAWSTSRLRAYTAPQTLDALCEVVESLRGGENRGTTLPTDTARNLHPLWYAEMRPHRSRDLVLDEGALTAINALARRQKTTPFVALATVVLLWQRHLTGKTDLSLMVTRDGRSVAAQSAIGSFIDDTVLRCASLGTASSFSDAVATVAAAWSWTLARAEQAPLAAWDQMFASLDPLPYVMLFDWISATWGELSLEGLQVDVVPPEEESLGIAESEFEMEFDEGSGTLTWQYDCSLYGERTVDSMASALHRVLSHCADAPDAPLLPPCGRFGEVLRTELPPPPDVRRQVEGWQKKLQQALDELEK